MNSHLCTEVAHQSLIKYGEKLCGDCVKIVEQPSEGSFVMVLADGLGSGVKANILSTLTATIISTMMSAGMRIEDCVAAIADTLPVCEVRNIAYSTFTLIQIKNNLEAEIIQYDNPPVILLREGCNLKFDRIPETIGDKLIYKSRIRLQENDIFISMSDGVIHAGVGHTLNFGWQHGEVVQFLERAYGSAQTPKVMTTLLTEQCATLYDDRPGDDTTVCAIKLRKRVAVNLLIGPPSNPEDLDQMLSRFFSQEGKYIVCGGTTSMLAAEYLSKPLHVSLIYHDKDIPPTGSIEGVDIVTEGIITINRVLEYAKDYAQDNLQFAQWSKRKDGASQIARMLFSEATDIRFFVGKAINPAHQNPDLPINFSIKMRLIEELMALMAKVGKRIQVTHY